MLLRRYFKLGQCLRGSSCSYSHEEEMPKSVVPCKFFQRGTCAFGRKCRFDHVRVGASGSTQPAQGTSVQPSSANVPDTKSKPKITTRSWADAPEFVPASARPGGKFSTCSSTNRMKNYAIPSIKIIILLQRLSRARATPPQPAGMLRKTPITSRSTTAPASIPSWKTSFVLTL
jgi:hypothetical protein